MTSVLESEKDLEDENNMSISDLIYQIEKISNQEKDGTRYIKKPRILISALQGLNEMIEMEDIKQTCIEIVCTFLIGKYHKVKSKAGTDKVFHFCNYGDPGTGKTKASKIIAKIIYGIGCNDKITNKQQKQDNQFEELIDYIRNLSKSTKASQINFNLLKNRHPRRRIAKQLKNSPENLNKNRSLVESKTDSLPSIEDLDKITKLCRQISTDDMLSKMSKTRIVESSPRSVTMHIRRSSEEISWRDLELSLLSSNENAKKVDDLITGLLTTDEKKQEDDDDPNLDESVYCIVCGRNELVAKFMGQSSGLAYDFMMSNRGKTIIIEEAYVLYEGEKDIFGIEALVEINRFMDEHPGEASISFNGYGNLLADGILRVQPGLKSRINYFLNMPGYKAEGLTKIFKGQLADIDIVLSNDVKIEDFFRDNIQYFASYGRDTHRLAQIVRRTYLFSNFDKLTSECEVESKFTISSKIFKAAVKRYLKTSFIL